MARTDFNTWTCIGFAKIKVTELWWSCIFGKLEAAKKEVKPLLGSLIHHDKELMQKRREILPYPSPKVANGLCWNLIACASPCSVLHQDAMCEDTFLLGVWDCRKPELE